MTIERCQFVFLCHREAIGRAIFHTVATKDAYPKIDAVVVELFLLRFFVKFPIHNWEVNGANPNANFAGNALIKFKVNSSPEAFRWNKFFVGILDGNWAALHVIERDRQSLSNVFCRLDCLFGVITNLLEELQHRVSLFRSVKGILDFGL